jgi:ketosteroid isomerase-like protein
MDIQDPLGTVLRFNHFINTQDLTGLNEMMTEDHAFIDSVGEIERGRKAMIQAWKTFFTLYPSYRNVFQQVTVEGDRVTMLGRSHCQEEPILDGPAIWTAHIRDNLVTEWRVYDDTPENRRTLGLC